MSQRRPTSRLPSGILHVSTPIYKAATAEVPFTNTDACFGKVHCKRLPDRRLLCFCRHKTLLNARTLRALCCFSRNGRNHCSSIKCDLVRGDKVRTIATLPETSTTRHLYTCYFFTLSDSRVDKHCANASFEKVDTRSPTELAMAWSSDVSFKASSIL